jgi:hypothetical protein
MILYQYIYFRNSRELYITMVIYEKQKTRENRSKKNGEDGEVKTLTS